ncbi:MAG: WD40 repeat domain-containing protein, partial [Gemmataceae bacterium]
WSVATAIATPFVLGAILGGLAAFAGLSSEPERIEVPKIVLKEVPVAAVGSNTVGPEPFAVLPGDSGAGWSVSISHDANRVATGLEDGTIKLWDVSKKRVLRTLGNEETPGHRGPVWSVHLSPDGNTLLSGGDEGDLIIWDLTATANGKTLKPRRFSHPSSVRAVAVHWERKQILTGDRSGTVRVFHLDGDSDKPQTQFDHGASVTGVAFTVDSLGLGVASSGTDTLVNIWEIPTQRKLHNLKRHKGPVYSVASSRDGMNLATGSWDGTVILWDPASGTSIKQFAAHEDGVWAVDFSCCGKVVATAGQDALVKIWDAETGTLLETFARHRSVVHTVKFSHDAKLLLSGGRDGAVRLWTVNHKKH